jgi:hypothetical protein
LHNQLEPTIGCFYCPAQGAGMSVIPHCSLAGVRKLKPTPNYMYLSSSAESLVNKAASLLEKHGSKDGRMVSWTMEDSVL